MPVLQACCTLSPRLARLVGAVLYGNLVLVLSDYLLVMTISLQHVVYRRRLWQVHPLRAHTNTRASTHTATHTHSHTHTLPPPNAHPPTHSAPVAGVVSASINLLVTQVLAARSFDQLESTARAFYHCLCRPRYGPCKDFLGGLHPCQWCRSLRLLEYASHNFPSSLKRATSMTAT